MVGSADRAVRERALYGDATCRVRLGNVAAGRAALSQYLREFPQGAHAAQATAAPGVLDAIGSADVIVFPPSNPVVSIGTILAVPGIRAALTAKTVVGVSPIIGGAPVRGMADACLTAIGVQTSAAAVAAHYGPELIDGWLVDDQDKATVDILGDDPALAPIEVRALPLYMRDLPATAAIARAALDLALELA